MMRKNGFTLLEIAVVTIIIGMLTSLGTIAVMKGIRNARTKEAQSELEMLSAAVLQLAWDTGRWPNGQLRTSAGSVEEWDLSLSSCGLLANDGTYDNWKGPYYDGDLQDPWWKSSEQNRVYFFDPDYIIKGVNRIVIGSFGPNGKGRNLYDSDDIYVLLDD